MTTYRRLKDAPRSCSVCKAVERLPTSSSLWRLLTPGWLRWRIQGFKRWLNPPPPPTGPLKLNVFSELLKDAYSGWQIHRQFFPHRRFGPFWKWDAYCADCQMTAAMLAPSFMSRMKKDVWKGGTIHVPFVGKP